MDNSKYILEFEKPLKDIEDRIENLKSSSINTGVDIASTVQKMEYELSEKRKEIYESLLINKISSPQRVFKTLYFHHVLLIEFIWLSRISIKLFLSIHLFLTKPTRP